MEESGKALIRRQGDSRVSTRWLVGGGIDLSHPPVSPSVFKSFLPMVRDLRIWHGYDGDAAYVSGIPDETYDFVHSSNLLEHLEHPETALLNWIRICKPGGHLILTIPDEDRYEQGIFPSFDPGHQHSFTIHKTKSWSPRSINVLDLLMRFIPGVEILKLEVLDLGFDYRPGNRIGPLFLPSDQTLNGLAESGIEIVLRKARPIRRDDGSPSSPTVLVIRWTGMGDVIMATPIIRRLRAELGEAARIDVATGISAVFAGNSDVQTVNPAELRYFNYDRIINLDRVYEADRTIHAVDAYMRAAFGDINTIYNEMFLQRSEPITPLEIDWHRAIVIHAGGTDRNRRMPRAFWDDLIELLIEEDLLPVIVGGGMDENWRGVAGVADLTQRFTIQETAWIIEQARCFISTDTGVMHIAGTTSTAMVTIYTAVRPEHRMPWRRGQLGWKTIPLVPALHCVGCNGGMGCGRGDFACVEGSEAISPQTAFEAIMAMVGDAASLP